MVIGCRATRIWLPGFLIKNSRSVRRMSVKRAQTVKNTVEIQGEYGAISGLAPTVRGSAIGLMRM